MAKNNKKYQKNSVSLILKLSSFPSKLDSSSNELFN